MVPLKCWLILIVIRLCSLIFTQTAFVPDEYWQSLEVAHKMTYGYGNMTWEWQEGIRSYAYPSIISVIYKFLHVVGLDSRNNLILMPRLMQTALSILSDCHFLLWICKETETTEVIGLLSICTSWFWFYCCTRTLANTVETSFTTIALSLYPWHHSKSNEHTNSNLSFMWFVGAACIIRPTACVPWIPLCILHIFTTCQLKRYVVLQKYFMICITSISISVLLDTYFYRRLVFSSLNFMYFNVMKDIGEFYGSHPAHWYITCGLPVVLGSHLIPFAGGCLTVRQLSAYTKIVKPLMVSIAWTIAVYSHLSHKEFRFIMPLLPMFLFISTAWLSEFHRTRHRFPVMLLDMFLVIGTIIPVLYLGLMHQRGTLSVMHNLSDAATNDPSHTDILFLMPCHSTPLYSHLHVNVSTTFLTCDPFNKDRFDADEFYQSPEKWLNKNYKNEDTLPTHVVLFDVLYPHVKSFFLSKNYQVSSCIFHAHFVEGRVGQYVYVLKQNLCKDTIV